MSRKLPKAGEIWRHFKNHDYLILACPVIHSETNERMICYKALNGAMGHYVRPLSMFMSEVDHKKYPDVKQKWRFQKVADSEGVNSDEFSVWVFALRYALPRHTYAPGLVCDFLRAKLSELAEYQRDMLADELTNKMFSVDEASRFDANRLLEEVKKNV